MIIRLCLLIVAAIFLSPNLSADDIAEEVVYNFKDELERDTPRGSVLGFISAVDMDDYEKAVEYLDLRGLGGRNKDKLGEDLARKLKFILDRVPEFDEMSLANIPKGLAGDGLSESRDLVVVVNKNGEKYSIFLDRMWGKKTQVWKFSRSTIRQLDQMHRLYDHGKLRKFLPPFLFEQQFLTLQLWQWLFLLLFAPIALVMARFTAHRIILILPRIFSLTEDDPGRKRLPRLQTPIFLFMSSFLFFLLSLFLNLTLAAKEILNASLGTIIVVGMTWLLLRSVDVFIQIFSYRLEKKGLYTASSMVPLGGRFVKILLLVITLLALLHVYSVNITALLAGLGVGGIAVALAAQKSLENLFSGIALITDQPVRVGDICQFNGQLGKVEDIGLRSTRIRTMNRSVLTVPNREFSQMTLENLSKRDKMKFECDIGVRYETSADQLRYLLGEMRKLLISHPMVLHDDRLRVRFSRFGDYSLDINVFCHIGTVRWYDYLAIREDLLLRMMECIEEAGASFAFPSRTVYAATSQPHDLEIQAQKEKTIDKQREDGNLPFPDFNQERYASFRNSISYPPDGSMSTGKNS
ncbi:MAG: mechanosensitive ion channel family protein [Pseudobacteriovorax sp.]|nr:mechanosensitive ion channel family protein [Pseudobacteriovorax sp.]